MENEFDMDEIEDMIEDIVDEKLDSVSDIIQDAIEEYLQHHDFLLTDGTRIVKKQRLRVLSPDKTKLMSCFGGLHIDDTPRFSGDYYPKGWGLSMETGYRCWEILCVYETKEDAVEALLKVKKRHGSGSILF